MNPIIRNRVAKKIKDSLSIVYNSKLNKRNKIYILVGFQSK